MSLGYYIRRWLYHALTDQKTTISYLDSYLVPSCVFSFSIFLGNGSWYTIFRLLCFLIHFAIYQSITWWVLLLVNYYVTDILQCHWRILLCLQWLYRSYLPTLKLEKLYQAITAFLRLQTYSPTFNLAAILL